MVVIIFGSDELINIFINSSFLWILPAGLSEDGPAQRNLSQLIEQEEADIISPPPVETTAWFLQVCDVEMETAAALY